MASINEMLQEGVRQHRKGMLDAAERLYRQILEAEPRHADALHLVGLVEHQRGQHEAGIRSIEAAIRVAGEKPVYHNNLGEAYRTTGHLAEAKSCYERAIELAPDFEGAHNNLGLTLAALGELPAAQHQFEEAVRLRPGDAQAHLNLGNVLRAQAKPAEAITAYKKALGWLPNYPEAMNSLGEVLTELGKHAEAIDQLWRCATLRPGSADVQFNLASAFHAAGQTAQAIAAYRQAITLQPNLVAAHYKLGTLLKAEKRFAEAAECHRAVLRLNPQAINSMGALAACLQWTGELEPAVVEYRRFLERVPDDYAARFGLATALHSLDRLSEAEVEYDRCAQSASVNADMYVLAGMCTQALGKHDKAAESYRKAIALDPERDAPHLRLGGVLLASGDFAAGWPEFAWRLKRLGRDFPQPIWDGANLDGKRIVIYAEQRQGLRDTLQMVRYVPLVNERGGDVVLDVQAALLPLLRESGFEQVVATGTPIAPPCDLQLPMMSLPQAFGTTVETIPCRVPYLSARKELVDEWHQRLLPCGGFKIGIHWHGSDLAARDGRVIPLAEFDALARVSGTSFISLQKTHGLDQIAEVADRFPVIDFADRLDEAHGALMDTAAIMRNLDLVVTNDTVTAHLAGALAVPVWVVLPYSAEWRWLIGRDDSPWYPTMRLFRQTSYREWSGAFERMAAELAELVARHLGH